MRDILDGLTAWRAEGEPFALATVVKTWNSAPRQPGASMAVSASGEVLGSVSGGCVEGAVYELAREVIETRRAELVRFGVTDDDAFAVGLTCGGILDVFVEPVDDTHYPMFDKVLKTIRGHRPVVVATVTSGAVAGRHLVMDEDWIAGSLGAPEWDGAAQAQMGTLLNQSATEMVEVGQEAGPLQAASVFVQAFAPPPRMIVFGAIDFASAVADIGKFLGYHVTVCDARPVFATQARFPRVDELVVDWPHRFLSAQNIDERTVLCVLTHDPKFDIPLLKVALETPAGYIGVMGSRRTHANRVKSLRDEGVPEVQLERLASPIGLDLGARTPEETAVSIAGEIIASTWGGTGVPLRMREGAIHR
ncbi:MAG: XdhC family protein [Mycobacterium sp.]|uniref:XdhC family protein n=1 Tax=Mycobacterium sp. TaxID=1785 RepID=UPI003F953FEF